MIAPRFSRSIMAGRQERQRDHVERDAVRFAQVARLFQIFDRPVAALAGMRRMAANVIDAVSLDVLQLLGIGWTALRADVHLQRFRFARFGTLGGLQRTASGCD